MRKLLLLLTLAGPAAAQEPAREGELTAGLRAVYYVPADGDSGAWGPGGQLRYRLNRRFGLEAAFDYQRHLFPETTVHTAAPQGSVLFYIPLERLQAFAVAGAGYFISRVHGPSYRRNLGRFAPHAGAGVELALTADWSLDAVYRHVWVSDLESRDPNSLGVRSYKRSGEQLTFGLNWRFGGRQP